MLFNKKGQTSAEYAITLGLVVAIAAGVLGVALKGGIRQKNKQAMDYLLSAGNDVTEFNDTVSQAEQLFTQSYRRTEVDAASFVDTSTLHRGGSVDKLQSQNTTTESVEVELIENINP